MKRLVTLLLCFFFSEIYVYAQGKDSITLNFSTPEDAMISFDESMLRKDLASAIACRDFAAETKLLMEQSEIETTDSTLINDMAQQVKEDFFSFFDKYRPNTSGIRARHFPEKKIISPSLVLLREVIIFKNQVIISQHYYISKNAEGKWKVLSMP